VDEGLQPGVGSFDLPRHVRELETDNWVLDEFLAECPALVGVLYGFLVADAGEADALDDDTDAFVVEVRHDHFGEMLAMSEEGGRGAYL